MMHLYTDSYPDHLSLVSLLLTSPHIRPSACQRAGEILLNFTCGGEGWTAVSGWFLGRFGSGELVVGDKYVADGEEESVGRYG